MQIHAVSMVRYLSVLNTREQQPRLTPRLCLMTQIRCIAIAGGWLAEPGPSGTPNGVIRRQPVRFQDVEPRPKTSGFQFGEQGILIDNTSPGRVDDNAVARQQRQKISRYAHARLVTQGRADHDDPRPAQ